MIDGLFWGVEPLARRNYSLPRLIAVLLGHSISDCPLRFLFSARFGCSRRNIGFAPAAANLPSEKATPL